MAEKRVKNVPISDPLLAPAPERPGDIFVYVDTVVPFLHLKVTASLRSGSFRVWQFEGSSGGRHVKRRIGDARLMSLMEARVKAFDYAHLTDVGKLPPTKKQQNVIFAHQERQKNCTYAEAFGLYVERHLRPNRKPSTVYDAERGLIRYCERFLARPVMSIKRHEVYDWHQWVGATFGRETANKQLRLFRACLNWINEQELLFVPHNPAKGIKQFPSNSSLKYLKQGEELQRLFSALEYETLDIRDAVKLLLWTAQRKSNVLKMEWSEIDFTAQVWLIPASKTKTGKEYCVPLTPNALEILDDRKEKLEDQIYVFPCARHCRTSHLKNINKAWLRIRERAGLPELRLHDLRHTAGTWFAQSGASAHEISRLLQRSSIRTAERYVHLAASDLRDKLDAVQQKAKEGLVVSEPEQSRSLPVLVTSYRRKNGVVVRGYGRRLPLERLRLLSTATALSKTSGNVYRLRVSNT